MKKQAARTLSTLSLLITLSVGASKISAFPNCSGCKPPVQYAASVPVQTTNVTSVKAPTPNAAPTETQLVGSDGLLALFWVRLLSIFASLI